MVLTAIILPAILEWAVDKSRGRSNIRLALSVALISGGIAILALSIFFLTLLQGETGTWKAVIEHISHRGTIEGNLSGLNNIGDNLRVWFISSSLYALFTLLFAGEGLLPPPSKTHLHRLNGAF